MTKYESHSSVQHRSQTETLYDVWKRSNTNKRKRANGSTDDENDDIGNHCSSAEFVPMGISFIDTALSSSINSTEVQKPIVIDISGGSSTGKSCTLYTMAARYLIRTTGRSQSSSSSSTTTATTSSNTMASTSVQQLQLPKVIIFNLNRFYNLHLTNECIQRMYNILSLMLHNKHDNHDASYIVDNEVQEENISPNNASNQNPYHLRIMECLQRLQIVTPPSQHDILSYYVYVLETLRYEILQQQKQHGRDDSLSFPLLLLWDDFLDEPIFASSLLSPIHPMSTMDRKTTTVPSAASASSSISAIRMDVIRQIQRLLQSYKNIILVTTSSTQTYYNIMNMFTSSAITSNGSTSRGTIHKNSNNYKRQRFIGGKEWNRYVTCNIHLEQQLQENYSNGNVSRLSITGNVVGNSTAAVTTTIHNGDTNTDKYLASINWKTTHNNNDNHSVPPQSIPFSITHNGIVL